MDGNELFGNWPDKHLVVRPEGQKERKKGKKTMKNRQKVSCEKIEKELTGSRNSVEWEPSTDAARQQRKAEKKIQKVVDNQ